MLRCSQCGTENLEEARFCRECGRDFPARDFQRGVEPASTPGVTLSAVACPSCGRAAAADADFCSNCGAALQGVAYGGFWRRFGGALIDAIIVGVAGGILGGILSASAGPGLSFLVGVGYYVALNANGGTLGKRIVGLRLQSDETGEDIGYGRALVRYIVAIASALALLLGYLWCIWDGKKQTWHDKAAGSVVVRQ